ncbi:MAG: DegT/DnrJ/EryC1/StrS family aminotransferase [Chromatiales bacterium]|jgi:dTDP-4-amino-4,6-dideoxygalactose transaminase
MSDEIKVRYIDLPAEFRAAGARLTARFTDVCSRGQFILRDEVRQLEQQAADYLGVKHAIGVASGSDALLLALLALGLKPGDEVITVAHTFVATVAAIHFAGATPVLVDVGDDHNMAAAALEQAISGRTRAVIPVHMNGQPCDMLAIRDTCARHDLFIIEDAAQAFGTRYYSEAAGGMGHIGCFSFHPMKVFHALGDAGLVTTNDDELAEQIRLLRNHGQQSKENIVRFGFNSRLDNLQAAMLLEFFADLDHWLERRREIALRYEQAFHDIADIALPLRSQSEHYQIYSSYVIETRQRDALMTHLQQQGIEVFAHWDPPLHKQLQLGLDHFSLPRTERLSREVLSLPIHPMLEDAQVDYVIDAVRQYYGQ